MEHKGSQSGSSNHMQPTVARIVNLTDVDSHHKLATVIASSAGTAGPVLQKDPCV